MKLGYFEAWIECEGKRLEEYQTERDGDEISCWIPSETGKAFSVHWKDEYQIAASACYIDLDGIDSGGRILQLGTKQAAISTFADANGFLCPVLFSALQMTDDEDLAGTTNKDLGTIKLSIGHSQVLGPSQRPRTWKGRSNLVHEKGKKMASHCVMTGTSTGLRASQSTVSTRDLGNRLKFIFRYRQSDVLAAADIMPRPQPVASSSGSGGKPNKPNKPNIPNNKRPRADARNIPVFDIDGDDVVEVKREKKRVKREGTELVDLTGDKPVVFKLEKKDRKHTEILDLTDLD